MGIRGSKFRDEILEKYKDILPGLKDWSYTDYMMNLREEIKNESWNNGKYDTFLKQKGWDGKISSLRADQICAWENIQKDIFQAVMDNYSTVQFTWEEKAKELIEEARKKHFSGQNCNVFNNNNKEIKNLPDADKKNICTLNTAHDLCIPARRSNFQFKTIKDNIEEITSSNQGSGTAKAILAVSTAIGTLAQQITDDIVPLKTKYQDNKDLCKFLRRTYADYKDIIEGNDIVDNDTSKGLYCLLNEKKEHLTGKHSVLSLLQQYFKEPVEKKLLDSNVNLDDNNRTPCNLDDSSYTGKPQCLRFLEEWFEEFMEQKEKEYEKRIKETCLEGKTNELTLIDGSNHKINCSEYCEGYQKLLEEKKKCYHNYISKCQENLKNHNTYNDETLYNEEVKSIQRETKQKYNCSDKDCGNYGSENLEAFFNPKKLSTNKIYCCGCINSVSDIKEIFGKNDNESSYIDAILNKLSICAPTDDTLDGAKDGKITTNSGKDTEICKINYGNTNLRGTQTCTEMPCKNYYQKQKGWICDTKQGTSDGRLKNEWSDATGSACLPPRTQRLCLGRIYDSKCTTRTIDNIYTNDKLLTELVIAAKHEGAELNAKYKGNDGHIPVDKISELCNAAQYSFADLGDIVKGTSIWESDDTNAMETHLRKIFAKIYRSNQDKYKDTDETYKKLRDVWWNTNRKHIWKALVCGAGMNTHNSCGDAVPNIDYMPQFLRWLTEWYDDYCHRKQKLYKDVETHCKPDGDKEFKCDDTECKTKCDEYTTFMKEKKPQWEKQNQYYDNKKNGTTGVNNNVYIESDAKDYLKDKFTTSGSSGSSDNCVTDVQTNINLLDKSSYYDVDQYCGCTKFIKEDEYDKISKQNNCVGLQNKAKEASGIKWIHNDGTSENRYLKDRNVPPEVYLPPRKQNLCFRGLDGTISAINVTDEKTLREHLMKVSATEGYNLGEYYKAKESNSDKDKDKYNYDVLPCHALKYSFLDLRDIILGHDMTETYKEETEKNLQKIFKKLTSSNGANNIEPKRKIFWEDNKECVWNAMKCGYKKGNGTTTLPSGCDPPNDSDYPIGDTRDSGKNLQFLRWFTEWGEDFCKKQHVELGKLETACKQCDVTNGTTCGNKDECEKCRTACDQYKKFINLWKPQYQNQSKKYTEDKSKQNLYDKDDDAKGSTHAYEYLNKKLTKMCKNSNTSGQNSGTDCNCMEQISKHSNPPQSLPASLDDLPNGYKDLCDCEEKLRLRKITDQNNSAGSTSEKSKICDEGNDGIWDEWDCTTENNRCVKKNEKKNINDIITEMFSNNNSLYDGMYKKEDVLFYYWFEKWLEDMERYLDKYMNYLKLSCGNDELRNKNKVNFLTCSNCRIECKCYDKLYNSLKSKWGEQKNYYDNYKKTSKDAGIGELPLNYYLYARCENKLEKNEKEDNIKKKEKCGEMQDSENNENIIDKMIKDKNNEKDKLCDKCKKVKEDVSKRDELADVYCDSIGTPTESCPKKRKRGDPKSSWNCNSNGRNNICVPDRRIQLCISYLLNITGNYNDKNDSLKSNMLDSASIEAQRLWDKHEINGTLDEDAFKKDLKRSYNDYRDFVLGNDMENAGNSGTVKTTLNNYFGNNNDTNGMEARKKWWDEHKYDVWAAMKCGIDKKKDNTKTDKFFLEVDDDQQIERWIKEWGDDFFEERKKKIENFGTQCKTKSNDNKCTSDGSPRTDVPCKEKCDNYKKWLNEKKDQWKVLSSKWKTLNKKEDSSNTGTSNSNMYDEPNNNLLYDCAINKNGCNFSDFSELLNIKGRKNNVNNEYGQFQNYCTCIYGIDISPSSASTGGASMGGGSSISNIDPCETNISTSHCNEKTFKEHDWTDMYTDAYGITQYLNGIQIPPRRRQLCLATLMAKPRNKDDLVLNLYRLAKREAQLLQKKYKTNGIPNIGNSSKMCRAIKRSYGDIRDIILQKDYVDGFSKYYVDKNITETLKDEKQGGGRSGVHANGPRQNNVDDTAIMRREDLWNEIKDNMWKAMTCNNNNTCDKDEPSDNDEFLRWLEEWYESFCEEKKEQLEKLNKACNSQNCNTDCGGTTCEKCLKQCPIYEEWLQKKKDQWRGLSRKYNELKMKNNNTLFQQDTKDKTDAQKYLDSICDKECSCETKNQKGASNNTLKIEDIISKNDNEYKDKYAKKCLGCELKNISNIIKAAKKKLYDEKKKEKDQQGRNFNPAPGSGTEDICKDVEKYITENEATIQGNGGCRTKDFSSKKWECEKGNNTVSGEGECMSPRRQSLCIHYLKESTVNNETNLRTALLKSVSLETYWLWEQYKGTHPDADDDLKKGKIPEDFKRQMFYTLGDFRDLVFETDIGSSNDTKGIGTTVKQILAKQNGTKTPTKPQDWWKTVESDVWAAMVCALTHGMSDTAVQQELKKNNDYKSVKFEGTTTSGTTSGTNLTTFVARPQFLRWMTEWAEQFCREYNKELETLSTACKDYECNGNKGNQQQCKTQCGKYEDFIKKWKPNYESQNKKFKEKKNEYQSADDDVKNSNDAREYLKKKLENMKCTDKNGKTEPCKYNCMKEESQNTTSSGGDKLPQSMDYPPTNYENKCNCKPTGVAKPVAAKPAAVRPPAAAAAKPVATKPEVPRPQAAKVEPPRGEARSHSGGTHTPKNSPGPTKTKSSEAKASPNGPTGVFGSGDSKRNVPLDPQDLGVTRGGNYIINQGKGTRTLEISTASSQQTPDTSSSGTGPTTSPTSAPTTSTTSGPGVEPQVGGGAASGEPDGKVAVPGTGTAPATQKDGNGWLDLLKKEVLPLAGAATQLGIGAGILGTIEAANFGLKVADVGLKTAEKAVPILYDAIKDTISSITNSGAGTQPAVLQPSSAEPDPGANPDAQPSLNSVSAGSAGPGPAPQPVNSGNSGSSGTGSTGNQSPQSSQGGGTHSHGSGSGSGSGPGPKPSVNTRTSSGSQNSPSPSGRTLTPTGVASLTTPLLSTTIPWSIGIVFAGIVYLWLKKKTPAIPTEIFRVLNIPQNDYGIPDETSTNRYVPYRSAQYKGKTYIYVEGDEPDDYIGNISSSDITSSSESEYEEMDINDIYPYKSPKYKTLIEVVLKPSTNNNVQDTYTDDVKYNSDIPINKLTDEECNELKQDFISNMLQNDNIDLPNENIIDDNIYKNIQPDIVDSGNPLEKPFIISIQDRYLDNHEKINYDIDWNIPKNINRTTNNMNDPKYVTSNDKYSGIDLINDSLNSGNDIYDELLKRKENELFGTKHLKTTTTNSVVKPTHSDPILNQLDLFDKWLDRHRYMCEKWNNKEEMLHKLKDEWNKENNEHILDIPLNDNDINKNNDENYNMINPNTQINHEGNDKTTLEHLGSTNIPYSDLITQNNDSERQNLRTNISMDIHFDENNNNNNNNNVLTNNVTHEEDHLENTYNF
ncbi:erythrocyte membrane protein 1 (PfEMP1), truncated, putative [Plasmodium gaboni]|uniref:Erythrocyte membrane protein 1 (PfEMP1), truncated, putative n=1 Tax=Plasmodium gaboni TaxID=647221 RepID=A0ABY1UQP1_9APIC|nr:erythrocyte membrane protein 1 (PfEMP1), truncated, putative [Plasmodium gaboni]